MDYPPPYQASSGSNPQGYAPVATAPPMQQAAAEPYPPEPQQQQPMMYQQAPQVQPPQQVVQKVVMPVNFGQDPVEMTCTYCQAHIRTTVADEPTAMAWVAGILLCALGCWLGCCLIPCCTMKEFTHTCPNCRKVLGRYNS